MRGFLKGIYTTVVREDPKGALYELLYFCYTNHFSSADEN